MQDGDETKEQLISELVGLRQRVVKLEAAHTERKRAEEALQESEDKYRTIFQSTGTATVIIEEDTTVSLANAEFEELSGYSKQEVEGKKCWTEFVVEEDLGRMKEYHQLRRIDEKTAPRNYEFRFRDRYGKVKNIFLTIAMIPGTKKNVASLLDITERKQAEEELEESERRYRLLAENAKDVIWTVDMNMRPTYISPSITRLLGYSVEEAMALPMEVVYAPASFETAMKVLAEELVIENMERKDLFRSRTLELELNRKDGSIIPVEVKFSFIRELDGRPVKILAIARDITERRRVQEELQIAEQNFRNSLESSPLGIRIVSTEGELLYANKAILDIYGYSSIEELKATPTKKRYTPRSYAEHQERKEKRKQGKPVPADYEISIVRKGGEIRHLTVSRKALVWDGEVQYQVIYQDITERKQTEEALKESEEKLRTILENTKDVIFQLSPLGKIVYVSPTSIELYGYKPRDLIGKHLKKTTPISELPKALKALKSVLSGEPISNLEINQLDANGKIIPVEINVTPVRKGGKIVALEGIMRDITERRQAEEDIRRAAEEWRATFDSITDLVSIHDRDFRLVRVNKAFADAVNMKPEELVGQTCYQVVHGTNEPLSSCPHMKTLETKEPAMADFFEPHLGIHLEVATSPIFNEKGEVVASVHVARDITQRKKMEEQLIVTDRLASIGELASGIAHELNNPLTSVIGFSDLLLDRDLPDDVKEDLKVVNREAQRTAGVVRNLLTFARKHPEEKQSVDINKSIENVLELRAYEQKVNNLQVKTRFAPDLPEITANSFDLQQVFLNIIINAEHFMTEAHGRGTFTITTERVGDIIRASFADDGPGISKENLGHLFDPFFTTKELGKGTGLGLSICHGILVAHGGRIYAESKLGKGATFVVELPVSQ